MIKLIPVLLSIFLLSSCFSEYDSRSFNGDYRFYKGISEFYDCESGILYFVANEGKAKQLSEAFLALKLKAKEDAFIKVEGYLKKESEEESLVPSTVFVVTKFISFDADRGCKQGRRQGL